MNLYLDLETIPTQSEAAIARIAESITAPGNYSKPESIAQWEAEKKPALVKDAVAKTALDGACGHICCIGWAIDDAAPVSSFGDERETIQAFLLSVDGKVRDARNIIPTIIGHNVVNFDIRFLWQRAIVLGIRMPHWFPRDPKPWSPDTFDTMTAFAGQRGTVSMAKLCEALGLEGKGDIDGSMVGDLWAAGEHERVAEYCRADVERTRAIHRRMQVAFGEAA